MILKIKKTSEVVDAFISTNKDGKVVATYYSKTLTGGQGGWMTTGIKYLVPLSVETDSEKKSEIANEIIRQKIREYKKLFKVNTDQDKIIKYLESNYKDADCIDDDEMKIRISRAIEAFTADI